MAVNLVGGKEGKGSWVFGYGSLMWNPGFPYRARYLGYVKGFCRRLCIYSHVHRGIPERPGLVLGLDCADNERDMGCTGFVFHVADRDWDDVCAYLRARELVTGVYLERIISVRICEGALRDTRIEALCFIVDRDHAQYAGSLSLSDQVSLIRSGRGISGDNIDYIRNTVSSLRSLGLRDAGLESVLSACESGM